MGSFSVRPFRLILFAVPEIVRDYLHRLGKAGERIILLAYLSQAAYRLATLAFATVALDNSESMMPIPQDLLDILVCPACKAPVKPTPDNGGLKCQSCRRVYPVRDEIPVMLIEEATIAPE
jgi:uncharacterized protein YbaR (Trm112 family)